MGNGPSAISFVNFVPVEMFSEDEISLNRTEKVESNSANRCELIVGDL